MLYRMRALLQGIEESECLYVSLSQAVDLLQAAPEVL